MRTLALSLVAVLALVACGDQPEEPDPSPSPEPDPTTEPDDVDGEGAEEVTVWFAHPHESGLWVEPETVALDEPTLAVGRAAMEALVAGDTRHPDRTTLAPEGTTVHGVDIDGPTLTVDLSAEVAEGSGASAQEGAFAQQLAHTAAALDQIEAVQLLVDGATITDLWGHVDWSEPLRPDEASVAPIVIDTPAWGATQPTGPVTATGTSMTFEATVELNLIDADGQVVEDTFTTAAQPGIDQRGDWEHTFETEATTPGTWTIEAVEPDPSAGEGRPPFATTTEIEVS